MANASIIGMGSAAPPPVEQEALWSGFFAEHFGDDRRARAVFRRSGVAARGGCVVPMEEDVRAWPTSRRMQRFVEEARPLGARAVEACLDDAGLDPSEVDLFAVVTCTGYATPGLDILIPKDLGMPTRLERLHIGHMGCYAAVPGLAAVSDACAARGRTAVLLCVELPSLHLQPPTDDTSQVVAHALFADAAAAVAVAPDRPGLQVVDVIAVSDPDEAHHMTWDVTDHGFRMGLSPKVPAVLERHVRPVTLDLLDRNGLEPADVAAWAVHPGGPRIIDVVGEQLGLDGELDTSRQVLAAGGNTSSATVLLILEQLRAAKPLAPGDHAVCMAFGPGLTLYALLLRQSG